MSVSLKITSRTGVYLSLSLMTGFAVSTTYAFAQYTQMASNNAPSGMVRTATIQECAQACAANMACGSFVYYTQAAMANVCQHTSSQTPMNIVGAISGVPHRIQKPLVQQKINPQLETTTIPLRKTTETLPPNFQNQARGQGNYAVSPITYGQAANIPNWNTTSAYPPQTQNPLPQQRSQQQTSQAGAISFVRPENAPQQQSQMQKYNPQAQYQQQTSNQAQQYKPVPVTQVQTYTPVPTNQVKPQMVTQQQVQNLRPVPAPQPQYYSTPQASNSANEVNYQNHSRQAIPEYSVARATEQANQQKLQQLPQQNTETVVDKPIREANLGPLRPSAKTQLEYDKYRDKDGMVDAAAMRRDMLKNDKNPRYSVESEWAGIAQNTQANQAAKIFENSAPIPLPPEINEKDLMTEDKADTDVNKPKKKNIFSNIFKRNLDEYAEPASEDVAINSQNDGPLRRK